MLPFTPSRGSIQSVRVDIGGLSIQPYLMGNLYGDLFSAVILIANHGDTVYKVPLGAITLKADPKMPPGVHPPQSQKTSQRALRDVVTEKCSLSDWEAAVNAETDNEAPPGGEVGQLSNSRSQKLLVGGLFQHAETFELSWKDFQSESDSNSNGQSTAFYVEAEKCVRVIASFHDFLQDGEGGLLEVVVEDVETKRQHKVVFVINQTMWARRIMY
ncbi:MAG: hypothetical protein KF886_16895 [Candidatus Hydrogenedentes bacterium]|nr:hypothetical protein [Candidatus Hydrogenedentota bacterium]